MLFTRVEKIQWVCQTRRVHPLPHQKNLSKLSAARNGTRRRFPTGANHSITIEAMSHCPAPAPPTVSSAVRTVSRGRIVPMALKVPMAGASRHGHDRPAVMTLARISPSPPSVLHTPRRHKGVHEPRSQFTPMHACLLAVVRYRGPFGSAPLLIALLMVKYPPAKISSASLAGNPNT